MNGGAPPGCRWANDREQTWTGRVVPVHNGAVIPPTIKLRWLENFVKVAEELHFGRAAATLHLSTSALSHQIRQLETMLDVKLLDRTTRRVQLTAAGKTLHAKVRPGLDLIAEGVDDIVARSPDEQVPTLTIGFVSALASGVIPAALRRFRSARPHTRIRLEQLGSREQLQRLAAGTLDAGFYWQITDTTAPASMPQQEVGRSNLHVALSTGHRLADEREVELSQLAGEEWLAAADGSDSELRSGFVALCRAHGFTPVVRNEATWIGSLEALVGAGLGVCAAPGPAIHPPPAGVVLRPVVGCDVRLIAARPDHHPIPRTDRFVADVAATMSALS